MATIRGALGDDERGDTGQRDGRGVLWNDDILNGLDEDDRSEDGDDRDGGGQLYFGAFTPETGVELYRYDPRAGEATLAADIAEGPGSSLPRFFTPLDGELYFTAAKSATGDELYRYDPMTGEAVLAADIIEGPDSSGPHSLTPLDGRSRDEDDLIADGPDDDGDDDTPDGEALSLAELLDDGALPVDGPAGTQPVTIDSTVASGPGPSVEDLVAAPENVVA